MIYSVGLCYFVIFSESLLSMVDKETALTEENQCKICISDEATIVFLPCGHLGSCSTCASSLIYCPICRTLIANAVRLRLHFTDIRHRMSLDPVSH